MTVCMSFIYFSSADSNNLYLKLVSQVLPVQDETSFIKRDRKVQQKKPTVWALNQWTCCLTDYSYQQSYSVNDRPSITSAASVAKQMYGSSMVKSAQDLERKLMPWKHASVILCPCRLMVPPITVPRSGSLQASADSLLPQMCSSTCCQWRWWRISDIHVSVTHTV